MTTTKLRKQIYEFIEMYVDTPEPKKLCSSIEDLVEELAESKVKILALSGVGNWDTFENNPPSEDGRYLLKQNEAVYIADYFKESDIWQDDYYNRITGVDYWMHLPE